MKRQFTKRVSVLVVLTITAGFLSAPANAFWYGNPIAEFLDPNTEAAYHDFLATQVVPVMQMSMMMFSNNPENDTGVTVYEPDKCWDGYTMLSSMGGYQPDPNGPVYNALLVDMEGNLVQKWAFANSGVPMKLLPGGYVMGGTAPPDFEGHLTQLDWDGNKVWEVMLHVHHDHQREGNPVGYYVPGMEPSVGSGKTILLDHGRPDPNLTGHVSNIPLLDDVIWEVDWEGNVTWEWHGWEHFEQMGFNDVERDAIMTNFPMFLDPNETDYLHTNSASWLGPNKWYDQGDLRFHPDNIIFDCRSNNLTGIIARHDHPDGQWKSGDIIWRVGPNFSEGNPEHKLGQIIGQHHAHMIPKGLPGAGNIMIFDNGGAAGYGPLVPGSTLGFWPNTLSDFSRIIEFNPITLDMVWEWKQSKATADYDGDGDIKGAERKFFSFYICNAQRLVNGNTMITEGGSGRVIEVTKEGDIVWEYISPYATLGAFGMESNWVYRAYRVPASWLPEGAVD